MALQSKALEIDMEFATIANTSLKVSRVALGTWALGDWMWGGSDEAQSIAMIQAAADYGISLIDTAPVYGFGHSEEIVGRAIGEGNLRDKVHIATKVGLEWRSGEVVRNATRRRIFGEIEDSLRRLRTDYVDIYQVHWPDPLVDVAETAQAMYQLHRQGKIRAIGKRFRSASPLHVLQPPYDLFEREIEAEILPYYWTNKIAPFGCGALFRGLLSGRMHPKTVFAGDDLRRIHPKFQVPRFAQYLSAVQKLDQLARERFGRRVIQLAVRWMLDRGITTALWGARHPDQLQPVQEVTG